MDIADTNLTYHIDLFQGFAYFLPLSLRNL